MPARILTQALILTCIALSTAAQPKEDPKMKAFIDALMAKMTLQEKIGQLNLPVSGDIVTGQASSSDLARKIREGKVGGLFNIRGAEKIRAVQEIAVRESRLKIPLIFGMDVIHGYRTVFPIPLAQTSSWDMDLIERAARISAVEATAEGICWNYSPMVDLCRDPRWGRIAEGIGEDPYLGGQVAKAMVRGYQGRDLSSPSTMMATVKHFALYGAAESGLDYNTTDMSRVRMYNEYLPPYRAAVEEGVGCVMTSFNDVEGIPATGNRWLVTEVLRNQWKFGGFVVSDYTSINEMSNHGLGDLKTVAALAMRAGVDMDMVGEGYLTTLEASLKEGAVTRQQVEMACRRILEAKYRLGLFQDPYRYLDPERPAKDVFTATHRQAAREIAAETFVLLRNKGGILPLKRSGTIALVGPLADNRENMPGTWSVAADHANSVSILDGLKAAAGSDVRILTARGCNLDADSLFEDRAGMFGKSLRRDSRPAETLRNEALSIAAQADVIVAALGESAEMTGESSSRSDIGIPGVQRELLEALLKTGKPVVLLLLTGRPLAIKWESEHVPAILNIWYGGTETGHAAADVLFGDVNPSGKLPATFPQNVGQIPLYYNHKNTGRPMPEGKWFQKFTANYLDVSNDPVYPFGYGLSYTDFAYSTPSVSTPSPKGDTKLQVSVKVTNTGNRMGKEVVQLYLRDKVASITRPVMELKRFRKIALAPGETREVAFTIGIDDLRYYNPELKHVWEPGVFEIMVGGDSRNVKKVEVNWSK